MSPSLCRYEHWTTVPTNVDLHPLHGSTSPIKYISRSKQCSEYLYYLCGWGRTVDGLMGGWTWGALYWPAWGSLSLLLDITITDLQPARWTLHARPSCSWASALKIGPISARKHIRSIWQRKLHLAAKNTSEALHLLAYTPHHHSHSVQPLWPAPYLAVSWRR